MTPIMPISINKWSKFETEIENLPSHKAKGDAFELFSFFYFKYFSDLYQIQEIYCPVVDGRSFPDHVIKKLRLESTDHGVDGVFINEDGKFIAWQAKFRSGRQNLTYGELATFWTEAEYADYRLIISNSLYLPPVAQKKQGHLSILVDRFDSLEGDFFRAFHKFTNSTNKIIERQKKAPRNYQEKILSDIVKGFQETDKGKLIAACGIGKTLISLWTAEKLQSKKVVFFAPSLQLVRQTLQEWSIESNRKFNYLCVCSDQTVDAEIDSNNIEFDDIDIPVTTSSSIVANFINKHKESNTCFIFCTYQSASVISEALEQYDGFSFDLALYDEAHRTAGVGSGNKFSIALRDEFIPSNKKLFLTATERLVRPRLSKSVDEAGLTAFSMDDEEIYGKVFHRLTFGEAIKRKIISDYRIVFTGISHSQLNALIRDNRYVKSESDDVDTIQNLYKLVLLRKTIHDLGVTKAITFHSKISEAKSFASSLHDQLTSEFADLYIAHINGAMSAQVRANIIQKFESASIGVISNVRCLTEGIDIPLIDAVFFADPKGSLIDIVQAVGRAVRQKFGTTGKIAYVIVPVLLDETNGDALAGQGFEALFNLIQAMRDQDENLAEWIDNINLGAVKGRIPGSSPEIGKIVINMPSDFDVGTFENNLLLKIADVNKNPTGTIGIGGKLGKNERRGDFTRVFKTLCDYTPHQLESSLIKPTLELIKDNSKTYAGKELRLNNNNVSHCKRVGLLIEVEKQQFKLSRLGALYLSGSISFKDVLKNQFLLYHENAGSSIIYPYREAFAFMKEVKKINYIQFVYSLYSIKIKDGSADLKGAIQTAKKIAWDYPNILVTNESNKPQILEALNHEYNAGFSYNNVWTDRTTAGNQYRYLMRHLEIFEDIFFQEGNYFLIKTESEAFIDLILRLSKPALLGDYGSELWIK